MRCVRTPDAPDNRRGHPEATHEVFREFEVASQQHKTVAKSDTRLAWPAGPSCSTKSSTSPVKTQLSQNVCCSPGGWFDLVADVQENNVDRKLSFPRKYQGIRATNG